MTRYVVGFLFDTQNQHVVLVEKKRPDWQAGFLNGPGGHIEPDDPDAHHRMSVEMKEECGVDVPDTEWKFFCLLKGNDVRSGSMDEFIVYFFYAHHDDAMKARAMTDENVRVLSGLVEFCSRHP